MSAILGILFLAVVVPYLASRVAQARNAPWTGPRTPAMRGRAMRAPAPARGTTRRAAKSAGAVIAHPGNRQIRAQAKADAFTAWQQAFATDYLERQRHARANGAAPATGGTATATRPTIRQRLRLVPLVTQPASPASGGPAGNGAQARSPRPRCGACGHPLDPSGRCPMCKPDTSWGGLKHKRDAGNCVSCGDPVGRHDAWCDSCN